MPIWGQRWSYWILMYLVLMAMLGSTHRALEGLWWMLIITTGLQLAKLRLMGNVKSTRMMLLTAGMQTASPILVYNAVRTEWEYGLLSYGLVFTLLAASTYLTMRNESGLPQGVPRYGAEASVASWFATLYVFVAAHQTRHGAIIDTGTIVLALIAGCGLLCVVLLRNTRIVAVYDKSVNGSHGHEKVIIPSERGINALWHAASLPSSVTGLIVIAVLVAVLIFHYVCSI